MKELRFPTQSVLAVSLLIVVAAGLSGCALVDFGAYDSFDEWYVCRKDTFNIEDCGVELEKHGHPDYVVNDMVIRSPVYLLYDTARVPLILVAAPYYMVKSLLPEGEKGDEEGEKGE